MTVDTITDKIRDTFPSSFVLSYSDLTDVSFLW